MTDQQIITFLQNSHYTKAVKGLYVVLPSVIRFIKNNSGTKSDAEDIFQDALVILYKKVNEPDFHIHVSIKTYLQAIVRNLWFQELRRRKKLPASTMDADIEDVVQEEEGRYRAATTAFNLLGEKCRQLLTLFYFKQQSFREIAAALAFSDEKTAKNQKYRCLQKAKENYSQLLKTGNHE